MSDEITSRMHRPEFLGLLHELLANDFVTAKVPAPDLQHLLEQPVASTRDVAEIDRVTAIIATPRRRHTLVLTLGFLASVVTGFVLTTLAL